MLMPKKTKYRKVQKGNLRGRSKGCLTIAFGEFGLRAVEPARVTSQQIESMRVAVTRRVKKTGRLYLRMFPDIPVTKKPAETRMGKGKGSPEFWVARVKRGRIVCEIEGVTRDEAKEILRQASYRLPMKTQFVDKANEHG